MNWPLPKKVVILYSDAKRKYFPTIQAYYSEIEVIDRAKIIRDHLEKLGIHCHILPGNQQSIAKIATLKPNLVINLVDTVFGKETLCTTITGTLDLMQIPYTGTSTEGLTICCNKFLTKNLLWNYGITTPKYQLFKDVNDDLDENMDFPIITKLNEYHGSLEMGDTAVSHNLRDLKKRVKFLITTYHQPVLAEEFIAGKEIEVIMLSNGLTKVYAAQKHFKRKGNHYGITTFNQNWMEDYEFVYTKHILPSAVKDQLKKCMEILRINSYVKFDMRLDGSGRHYLVDCNPNTSMGPKGNSPIGNILNMYDINFTEILKRIMHHNSSK